MYKYCFLLFTIISCLKGNAQPLSAFTDFQNRFYVWDDGFERKIDYLIPLQVAIGRDAIGYIDNAHNFKIYHNGGVTKINDGFTSQIYATDYLVPFRNNTSLLVWENGHITRLSSMVGNYSIGDSVILYFDGVRNLYNAYYAGEIYPIENFLGAVGSNSNLFNVDTSQTVTISSSEDIASGQLPSAKASDNIIAYVNYANIFRIFYHGQIIEQEPYLVQSFDVGRNTVAYIDANQQFKIFHNGNTRLVDDFVPDSYAAGDDLVAFIGSDKDFKIYYNDSLYDLGYFQPDYKVGDNVVAFQDANGFFKVFYKGTVYTLDNFYPTKYTIAYNSVAYISQANMLRQFCDGNIYDITTGDVAHWQLNYDVVQYRFGSNLYKVFYKGQTY